MITGVRILHTIAVPVMCVSILKTVNDEIHSYETVWWTEIFPFCREIEYSAISVLTTVLISLRPIADSSHQYSWMRLISFSLVGTSHLNYIEI